MSYEVFPDKSITSTKEPTLISLEDMPTHINIKEVTRIRMRSDNN